MVLKAVKEFDISLVNSWVIGDKDSDIELGKNCNMKTIYLKNNKYKYSSILQPDFTARFFRGVLIKLFLKNKFQIFFDN